MIEKYFRQITLFKQLSDEHLEKIASNCRRKSYKSGDVIFYKTDPATDLYIVLSGRLKATLKDEGDNEVVLSIFKTGNFFGEMNLLDGKGRSATVIVEEDCELAIFKKNVFIDLLAKYPVIAFELLAELVERLRKADGIIESLVFLDVSERVVRALLEIAKTEGEKSGIYIRIKKRTHRELATITGASREAVSKCLKLLSSKGIVHEAEGYILIAEDLEKYYKNIY